MNDKLIGQITSLIELRKQHEAQAACLATELKQTSDMIANIDRVDLPELMREAEVAQLRLTDGTSVELKEKVQAAITEANQARAHKWLTDHGFGGLIKTVVSVSFPAAERARAQTLGAELSESYGNATEVKEAVHPATLRAFIAEQLEAGNEIPMALFSVFTFSEVKVKPPKQR